MKYYILLLSQYVSLSAGAGFTSHNVAARRASQFEYFGPETNEFNPSYFYGLAEDRSDAIQGGSPFPDYLYACGTEHDAGEEAHWTPFQIYSAEYIRDQYPTWMLDGRDSDGAGLVAFMMGVTSHYIADINWHGLEVIPSGEGLIRTMGYADFNCTDGDLCSTAHSAADTGGEFAAAASLDLSWYPQKDWYLPTEDLVNIYATMNASGEGPLVEPEWIKACGVIFYAGSFGVSRFGDLIYPLLAPFLGGLLLEDYFEFPVGGVDDDAAWTSFMWNRFADWLIYGPPPPDPPPNYVDDTSRDTQKKRMREGILLGKRQWVSAMRDIIKDVYNSENEFQYSGGGLFEVYNSRDQMGLHGTSKGSFIGLRRNHTLDDLMIKKDTKLLYLLANSLIDNYLAVVFPEILTHSASTLNNVRHKLKDRAHELAQSLRSPSFADGIRGDMHHGSFTSDIDGIGFASGSSEHEYFARSLSASSDGSFMVGSPGSGRIGGPQEGTAKLFFHNTNSTARKNSNDVFSDPIIFYGGRGGGRTDAFPTYERFGWSSAACDMNGDEIDDWIICAPSHNGGRDTDAARGNYTGRCDIFYAPFRDDPVPDASVYGDKEWGNFGYNVLCGDVDGDGHKDVVIAAPFVGSYPGISANDRGDLSSQGAVYVYMASNFEKTFLSPSSVMEKSLAASSADVVIQPDESFQWFGKSLASSPRDSIHNLFVVGAPSYHSAVKGEENSAVGRVYVYPSLSSSSTSVDYLFTVTGCGHSGRTGHAVALSSTHLAFSETHWNGTTSDDTVRPRDTLLRAGRVFVVPLNSVVVNKLTQSPVDYRACDLATVDGVIQVSGDTYEGRFGSSISFDSTGSTLFVGAPLADDGVGRVYSVDIATGKVDLLLSGAKYINSKGRLGQALMFADTLYVSAPYATINGEEECGRLFRV